MVRHPSVYAQMLAKKIKDHQVSCWLVNTGWTGGPYGVGSRMKIELTRALLNAALAGTLDKVPMKPDPIFGVLVPMECPGVPSELLDTRRTWSDTDGYDAQARRLAILFHENFEQFKDQASPEVQAAGPRVG